MRLPKAIFLMGPTAAGKTDAAILLHDQYQADIISVDSALVYKGMDIGSAKPDAATLEKAPHALVDVCETWQPYSASNFCSDAKALMQQSIDNGRLPLLAGGTMLYYNALQNGLSQLPQADPEVREKIQKMANELGWEHVHGLLAEVDPDSAARIHPNDPQRINRAYEVYLLTGQSMTTLYAQDAGQKLDYDVLKIIISPADRSVLHERIAMRFEQMLAMGFLDEMKTLMAEPRNHDELPSMRSVGYRQAWEHLEGKTTMDEFIFKGIAATRQLAKRQLTWLRKEPDAIWLDPMQTGYLNKLQELVDALKNQ
ncbi:tRNA (adenosine(37)-N6)-dimethylallyltransferase MiaA [Marinicella sp. S1101]|uniref:tRNA (adenosine(37)-N6)-dimethylallyltransferase MiaA n=1 Tax=Marinicella marina TaxID=2996016 RepID=UPI002260F33C|nr:tRNA (adenosine(37)-N6)-dimethylallyltransferase MiaA [Marinicella marina]MCX7552568.1 tRNA (adenosine(37)-N6)-dimethylallyltransferase MiaA [Marinicella marina]MDJ1139444.1 tRNA (adenosine(37)-N6)-dimethylallyltransferase MiaA [Marinicella marina]